MEGGTYYCAHAAQSTRQVNSALRVKERFDALARDGSPEEFKAEWERFLADAQAFL